MILFFKLKIAEEILEKSKQSLEEEKRQLDERETKLEDSRRENHRHLNEISRDTQNLYKLEESLQKVL